MGVSFRRHLFCLLTSAVSLAAQGNVIPLLECNDFVTRSGSTVLTAAAVAGENQIQVSETIPERARIVINPGGPNEETIHVVAITSSAPYQYHVIISETNILPSTLTRSHSAGETVVFEISSGAVYFGYFNLLGTPVTLPFGADNFFLPGNPNRGQPTSFAPGVHRFSLAVPHLPNRELIWILNSLQSVSRDVPAFRCGNARPTVRAESMFQARGTTRTNVRLGTVSASSPTTFSASVPYVSRRDLSDRTWANVSNDVTFSNLRVENGVILGDITVIGSATSRLYTYTLRAVTPAGDADIATATIEVTSACPLTLTPGTLPNGFVNTPYATSLQATGAVAPYRFRLEASSLPLGLTLSEAGVVSGTPQQTGTFPVTLAIASANGCFDRTNLTLEIQGQFCAANITPQIQVTLGGFRQNLITRRWQQTVTLSNNTQSSIFGPVAFVLDNLSANATVLNPAGTTTCAEPFGRPFFLAPIGNTNFFAAGSSVSLNLEFTTTTAGAITYTPRVIAGGAIR
jgi:hypothetical protein